MFNMLVNGFNLGFCTFEDNNYKNTDILAWKEKVGAHVDGLFNFLPLEKIEFNSKYIVYLSFYHHLVRNFQPIYNFNQGTEEFLLPDRIYNDSGKGLVHWLIDHGTECIFDTQSIDFEKLCNSLNTKLYNITLITGAETKNNFGNITIQTAERNKYNCITDYSLYGFLNLYAQRDRHNKFSNQKVSDILHQKKLKYKSLCYNRIPRRHRTTIVAHIIKNNYQNECLYSLGIHTDGQKQRSYWENQFPELRFIIEKLKYGPPIYPHIREEGVYLEKNQASRLGWEHGINSYFQLVTETTPEKYRYPFITEKSLKPFAMLQPFIQFGPKNNVKNLKNYGYDVFDNWINHDYDDIDDDIERLKAVLREFDRLQNIDTNSWSLMLKKMTEPLLHNLQLVKKPVIRNLSSQLIPVLYKFLENDNKDIK